MNYFKNIIYGILLFLSLFFGTGLFLLIVTPDREFNGGEYLVYNAVKDGFSFVITLLCIIFSIVIIILYKILIELKKINSK